MTKNNTTPDTGTHTPDDATRILKNLDALYESEIEDEIADMTPEQLDNEIQRLGVNIPALRAKIFGTPPTDVAALIANEIEAFRQEVAKLKADDEIARQNAEGSTLALYYEGKIDAYEAVLRIPNPIEASINVEKNKKE